MRSPPISRRSRCRCCRARRCCSMPIWSIWSPPAHPEAQVAIAGRAMLPRSLAAAIAEVGSAEACLALLGKSRRRYRAVLDRPHRRALRPSGGDPRDPAGARRSADGDPPGAAQQAVADARRLRRRAAMAGPGACANTRRARPARRRPSRSPPRRLTRRSAQLVQHLRESGQLTAGLILRALLSGNVVLFEEALAELSGVPLDRVTSYIHDRNISGFRALYRKAGLPDRRLSGVPRGDRGHARGRLRRRAGRGGAAQAAHGRARADALARPSAVGIWRRCWRCCGASRPRPRARKRACSATIWSPTIMRSTPAC